MTGINDAPEKVEPLLDAAVAAGSTSIGGAALHLRASVREVFMGWLRAQRPDLLVRYERLYGNGAYAPKHERLSALMCGRGKASVFRLSPGSAAAPRPRPAPQLTLF